MRSGQVFMVIYMKKITYTVFLLLLCSCASYAQKLKNEYSKENLSKVCRKSTAIKEKMSQEKKDKLCDCVAGKFYAGIDKAEDLPKKSYELMAKQANDFFQHPKDEYTDDTLNAISSLYDYIDQCSK